MSRLVEEGDRRAERTRLRALLQGGPDRTYYRFDWSERTRLEVVREFMRRERCRDRDDGCAFGWWSTATITASLTGWWRAIRGTTRSAATAAGATVRGAIPGRR